jgi:hypothetical protein
VARRIPLSERFPEASEEFLENLTRPGIGPDALGVQSSDVCRWRCRFHGEVWSVAVQSRTVKPRLAGCGMCSTERTWEKRSRGNASRSLATVRPELAAEFLSNKTHPNRGSDVVKESSKDVATWRCSQCGARYESTIAARSKRISPRCSRCNFSRVQLLELHVSALVEAAIGLEVQTGAVLGSVRPDLWIPSLSVGFDLDPEWSHRHRFDQDVRKTNRAVAVMDFFFRVREAGLRSSGSSDIFVVKGASSDAWATAVCSAMSSFVTVKGLDESERKRSLLAASALYAERVESGNSGSFAAKHPSVAARFVENLDRPGIGPDLFAPQSNYKCIWRCVHGAQYPTTPQKAQANTGTMLCAECNALRSLAIGAVMAETNRRSAALRRSSKSPVRP